MGLGVLWEGSLAAALVQWANINQPHTLVARLLATLITMVTTACQAHAPDAVSVWVDGAR